MAELGRGVPPVVPEHAQHGGALSARHLVDWTRSEVLGVQTECVPPLAGRALGVAPGGPVARDHLLDGVHDRGDRPAPIAEVAAPPHEADVAEAHGPRGNERDCWVPAVPDVGLASIQVEALMPGLDARRVDVEDETEAVAAIAVRLRATLWEVAGDERGGELFRRQGHAS